MKLGPFVLLVGFCSSYFLQVVGVKICIHFSTDFFLNLIYHFIFKKSVDSISCLRDVVDFQ